MSYPIKALTVEAFAPYGLVLALPIDAAPGFHVVLEQPAAPGWAWAVSKVPRRHIDTLGAHPDTKETFEPMGGVALIAVARPETPEAFEVFVLDRPVCVFENTWHATCALSEVAFLKTVENAQVTGVTHALASTYRRALAPA